VHGAYILWPAACTVAGALYRGSNMYERALTYGCGITSQRDTFNCTCPEALYGQAGWTCSCRVVEALDKAVLAAEAVSCDGALFVQVRAFSAPRHH
jgi:hypothetical protein